MSYNIQEEWFVKPDKNKDEWILKISEYHKDKLIKKLRSVNKLKLKLKMMEISFEQINNSRNNLLRQLARCEETLENKNGL